jgi:fructosamine-3-kinase
MHRQRVEPLDHGLDHDGFIGLLPQQNGPCSSWVAFYRDRRIGAQLRLAVARGALSSAQIRKTERLMAKLAELIPDGVTPSLLHGDLWSGNTMVGADDRAVLVDPAVYRGHREVELAMTELFGGFPKGFYAGYREVSPVESGYAERRDLYQLYPVLVHVNLFGGGYGRQAEAIVDRYL